MKLTVTNQFGSDNTTQNVTATVLSAPVAVDGERCGSGVVNLSATASSGGDLNWYDAATGGTLLHTGSTYSPNITANTNFWVEESTAPAPAKGGPATPASVGAGGYFADNDIRGIFLDVISDVTIKSVLVDANGAGTRTVELLDGDGGNVIETKDIDMADGQQRITLDWTVPAGTGYYMKITGSLVDLYRNNAGASYPYDVSGLVSLTGNNYTDQGYYYFFYDWEVQGPGCVSERTQVTGVTDVCTGLDDPSAQNVMRIAPNPTTGVINVNLGLPNANSANLIVMNLIGEVVYQKQLGASSLTSTSTIDLRNQPKGVYLVRVQSEQHTATQRIVVE
ncbi:MAG: T9SS type A sorting domain-containing protein [Flavobacteriales bacterium]|nr:T9SS type A sorting domain-containing protein [Flavobacteriales bacterium]